MLKLFFLFPVVHGQSTCSPHPLCNGRPLWWRTFAMGDLCNGGPPPANPR